MYIQKFKPDFLRNYCAVLNQILYESFHVQGNENLLNDAGYMTKMAARPVYGKYPSRNLLLRNQQADFYETWYVASGTPVYHSLFMLTRSE